MYDNILDSDNYNLYDSPLDSDNSNLYDSPLNLDNSNLYDNILNNNTEIFNNYIFIYNIITEQFELIQLRNFFEFIK